VKSYSKLIADYRDFKIRTLICECWHRRAELEDDEDRAFLESYYEEGATVIKRKYLGWLLSICRKLNVIERYM
jgi:hypothetical protein